MNNKGNKQVATTLLKRQYTRIDNNAQTFRIKLFEVDFH